MIASLIFGLTLAPIPKDALWQIFEKEQEVTIEVNEEYKEPTTEAVPVVTAPAEPAPTTQAEPTSNYLGTYKITGYVATGNPCANGNYPTAGYTIASNSLAMGTRVYIEGIGERVVEDRGGMAGNVIDVFVGSVDEAYALTGYYEVYLVE